MFELPLRAWLVADSVTIPAIATHDNIAINANTIALTIWGGGAELYATSLGKRYVVEPSPTSLVEAEVSLSGTTGKIRVESNREFVIKALPKKGATAYFLTSATKGTPVDVVEIITGDNQILVKEGGAVEASLNLSGKLIKFMHFPLIHPPAVSISSAKIEQLLVRLVYRQGKEFYLADIPVSLKPFDLVDVATGRAEKAQRPEDDPRQIEFIFNPNTVKYAAMGNS